MEDRLARALASLLLIGILVLPGARADARAESVSPASDRDQCTHLSRYALAARALAEASVDRQAAGAILDRMMRADQRVALIAARVLEHAYREKTWPPRFADQVEAACLALHQPPAAPLLPRGPQALQPYPVPPLPERRAM